jgi:hypothetical protein
MIVCPYCRGDHPAWECPTAEAFRRRNGLVPETTPATEVVAAGERCPTCGRKPPGRARIYANATERVRAHRAKKLGPTRKRGRPRKGS